MKIRQLLAVLKAFGDFNCSLFMSRASFTPHGMKGFLAGFHSPQLTLADRNTLDSSLMLYELGKV